MFDRRTLLRTAGAVGAATLGSGQVLADELDTGGGLQEALVVFESNAAVERLAEFDLADGFHRFEVLPIGYARLTGDQLEAVAALPEVRFVAPNRELEFLNDDAREVTGVNRVQEELFYDGDTVHVAVIDSGVDGSHRDLTGSLRRNFRFANPLDDERPVWTDAGRADTDDVGHGTHCTGTIAGDGTESDGRLRGMAPGVTVSSYSTGATLFVLQTVTAFDHLLANVHPEDPVQLTSNSYGGVSKADYNPDGPMEVAVRETFEAGILNVFSAGNSGPGTNTLNDFAKAPHVMCIAATDDGADGSTTAPTGFSSRGRARDHPNNNYDRLAAFENLADYHAAGDGESVDAGTFSGTAGPGVTVRMQDLGADAGKTFHELEVPEAATELDLTLSWTPPGQHLDLRVRRGGEDGTLVATTSQSKSPDDRLVGNRDIDTTSLSTPVGGGATYTLEVDPYNNVAAQYEIAYDAVDRANVEGPIGLYRNSVGAPGQATMSTMNPNDPLGALAPDAEPWYAAISGTSMSCPVVSGVAALTIDAYYQNEGEYPEPMDVLNTLEVTAAETHPSHDPVNMGAGFVQAVPAVERAEAGDLATFGEETPDLAEFGNTPETLSVSGVRDHDASVYTGGQTDSVDLTVSEPSHAVTGVVDVVPAEWDVLERGPVRRVEETGGVKRVFLAGAVPAGESRTFTYFVEAPSGPTNTGRYSFGPAEARSRQTGGGFVTVGGTSTTVTVVGQDTNV